jgi:hypothetical protein
MNVWFRFIYPRNETVRPRISKKIIKFCLYIHVSVSDLYIPRIGLPILLQPNRQTDPGYV